MYRYTYSVCTLKSRDYIDGLRTMGRPPVQHTSSCRTVLQGNQMRVATATRFSFFLFFLFVGRHLVILAENRTSFRGNVAQQMRRREKERERETQRECAQRDLPWVDWASCNWLWAADQVNCTTTTAAMTLTATTAKAKRARTLSREGKLERSKSSLFTPTMGIFCVSADCRWGLAMNESSDRRKNKQTCICVCVCVNRESSSRKMRALSTAMQGALYLIIRLKYTIEFISIRGWDIN